MNGTFVNTQKIGKGKRVALSQHDEFGLLKAQIRRRWALTALKSNAEVRFIAARRIMLGDVPDLASPDLGPEGDALYHSATVGG